MSDYDTETYDTLEWLVFLAASMINIIIMLNLLIAIFSDTYTRVKENRIIADQLELASLIYEGEVGLFYKRKIIDKIDNMHKTMERIEKKLVN